MVLQLVLPLALAIAATAWTVNLFFSPPWTWILGIPTALLLWVPAAMVLGFVIGLLGLQPRELIRMFEMGWERGASLWKRRDRATRGGIPSDLRLEWERSIAESEETASRSWQQLRLDYPTSPVDHPEFLPWVELVVNLLSEDERLVDFGSANEVDMLLADPGSASGEGVFAVTNLRSLFMYVDAPREADKPSVLELRHQEVMAAEAETAWADPATGAAYAESDAPSKEAVHEATTSGMVEMAFVSLDVNSTNRRWPRRTRFLTGEAAGNNWATLIRRFKEDSTMPDGWEPPSLH